MSRPGSRPEVVWRSQGFRRLLGGHTDPMQESTLRECFDAIPATVPRTRHLLIDFVTEHCANASKIVDAVALTTSEAVGNVVRHAYGDDTTGQVEIAATTNDDSLVITIRDQGAGVDAPTSNPGQGLGLHIMRAMAEATVETRTPAGTEVTLRFPCEAS